MTKITVTTTPKNRITITPEQKGEIKTINTGGGGVGVLRKLKDVDATSLVDGYSVVYDISTDKFVIKELTYANGSNTVITFKIEDVPSSLSNGEPAYSFSSNVLYIGANGSAIPIAGKYYVDLLNLAFTTVNTAFNVANAAFASANNVAPQVAPAFNTANAAYITANAAYAHSNATYNATNSVFAVANAAFASANNVAPQVKPAFDTANAAYTSANTAGSYANQAGIIANSAFGKLNSAYTTTNSAYTVANAAFGRVNSVYTFANGIYNFANTRFSSNGGIISGNVSITGTLSVSGNTYFIDQQTLRISDPLIYLAGNNYTSDLVDIGFIANYVNTGGSNVHTGLYRSHLSKEYFLFQGYNQEPIGNYIDPTANGFALAVLNADLITGNLTLNGANAYVWINSAYDTVNSSYTLGNSNYIVTNAAFERTNAVYDLTNAAFDKANTGTGGFFVGNNGDVGEGLGLGDIFRVHTNTLSRNATIYSGNNATAAGPLYVASGVTLTVQSGARVVIV